MTEVSTLGKEEWGHSNLLWYLNKNYGADLTLAYRLHSANVSVTLQIVSKETGLCCMSQPTHSVYRPATLDHFGFQHPHALPMLYEGFLSKRQGHSCLCSCEDKGTLTCLRGLMCKRPAFVFWLTTILIRSLKWTKLCLLLTLTEAGMYWSQMCTNNMPRFHD